MGTKTEVKKIRNLSDLENLTPGQRIEILILSVNWFGDRTVYVGNKKTTSPRLQFIRQDPMNRGQIEYVVIDPSEGKEIDGCYRLTNHKKFKLIRSSDKNHGEYFDLLKNKGVLKEI